MSEPKNHFAESRPKYSPGVIAAAGVGTILLLTAVLLSLPYWLSPVATWLLDLCAEGLIAGYATWLALFTAVAGPFGEDISIANLGLLWLFGVILMGCLIAMAGNRSWVLGSNTCSRILCTTGFALVVICYLAIVLFTDISLDAVVAVVSQETGASATFSWLVVGLIKGLTLLPLVLLAIAAFITSLRKMLG